jgi:hypothetical protein
MRTRVAIAATDCHNGLARGAVKAIRGEFMYESRNAMQIL